MPHPWRILGGVIAAALVFTAVLALTGHPAAVPDPPPPAPDKVTVMEWNLCGNNPECAAYDAPDALSRQLRDYLHDMEPGGVAILEEVCADFAKKVESDLDADGGLDWDVRFIPIKIVSTDNPDTAPVQQCSRGRGDYGMAIALPTMDTSWDTEYLPSPPDKEWRVAACANLETWSVTVCGSHFSSPSQDPHVDYRSRQVTAFRDFVATARYPVVFGGDLNLRSPAEYDYSGDGVNPLYDSYVECAQSDPDDDRTGVPTHYLPDDGTGERQLVKIDYLYTDPALPHECDALDDFPAGSDHLPIWITVDLP